MRDGSGFRAHDPDSTHARTRLDHKSNEPTYWPTVFGEWSVSVESKNEASSDVGTAPFTMMSSAPIFFPYSSHLHRGSHHQCLGADIVMESNTLNDRIIGS